MKKGTIVYEAPAKIIYKRPGDWDELRDSPIPEKLKDYTDYLSAVLDLTESALENEYTPHDIDDVEKKISFRRLAMAREKEISIKALEWVTLFKLRLLIRGPPNANAEEFFILCSAGAIPRGAGEIASMAVSEIWAALCLLNRRASALDNVKELPEYISQLGRRAAQICCHDFEDAEVVDMPSLADFADEGSFRVNIEYLLEMNELFLGIEEMLSFVENNVRETSSPLFPAWMLPTPDERFLALGRIREKVAGTIAETAATAFSRLSYEMNVLPNEPHAFRDRRPHEQMTAMAICSIMRPAEFRGLDTRIREGPAAAFSTEDAAFEAAFIAVCDSIMRLTLGAKFVFHMEVIVLGTAIGAVLDSLARHPHAVLVKCFSSWYICEKGLAFRVGDVVSAVVAWAKCFSERGESPKISKAVVTSFLRFLSGEKTVDKPREFFSAPSFVRKRKQV